MDAKRARELTEDLIDHWTERISFLDIAEFLQRFDLSPEDYESACRQVDYELGQAVVTVTWPTTWKEGRR